MMDFLDDIRIQAEKNRAIILPAGYTPLPVDPANWDKPTWLSQDGREMGTTQALREIKTGVAAAAAAEAARRAAAESEAAAEERKNAEIWDAELARRESVEAEQQHPDRDIQDEGEFEIRLRPNRYLKPTGTYPRPAVLQHNIANGKSWRAGEIEEIIDVEGLRPQGGWADIQALIPQRPKGVFFWDADYAVPSGWARFVDVSALDTDLLWAFPQATSDTADIAVVQGDTLDKLPDLVDEDGLEMFRFAPQRYDEYDGTFFAEWIYCGDIPAHVLRKER